MKLIDFTQVSKIRKPRTTLSGERERMSERKKKKRCDDDDGISSSSKGYVYGDDCDVCGGGDSYEENLIVICEGCGTFYFVETENIFNIYTYTTHTQI
jgi:hypothetical protein